MVIIILLWLGLTIFSFLGYALFAEFLWEKIGYSNTISTVAVILNFYLSNLLAMLLTNKSPLMLFNRSLIFLVTAILLVFGEMYLGYYILNDLFKLDDDSISLLVWMFVVFFLVAVFGGLRFFLILILDDLKLFFTLFFEGLEENTINRVINQNQQFIEKPEIIESKREEPVKNSEKEEPVEDYDFYKYQK